MSERLRFVSGAREFAQRTLEKLDVDDNLLLATRNGRMIFCSGDEDVEAVRTRNERARNGEDYGVQEEAKATVSGQRLKFVRGDADLKEEPFERAEDVSDAYISQNNERTDLRTRPQSPAAQSGDIYNRMQILGMLYQDLQRLARHRFEGSGDFRNSASSDFVQTFEDMIQELGIVTFAMGRIYQNLSRSNRLPNQNQRKPEIRDFCSGLRQTQTYLRNILADLRRLQRDIDNDSLEIQLFIIYHTLSAQNSTLGDMRMDCRN